MTARRRRIAARHRAEEAPWRRALKRLYEPEPVAVEAGPERAPLAIAGVAVESVREQWVVEDRWWEPEQLRRAYFELALADGRVAVVFSRRRRRRSLVPPARLDGAVEPLA